MTDFHRSLDRALEHEPRWAINHTTAFDSYDPHTDWGSANLSPLIAMIDRIVQNMTVDLGHERAIAAGFMYPLAQQEIPAEGVE